jgi:hypothetical protein
MSMKKWWARVRVGDPNDYGYLVPTGMTDLQEAKDYLVIHKQISLRRVKEWLQL